jgi:hypothetical protein
MNIIVKPYGGESCYCRPDTTWERENKDFYVPECVETLYWTPVLFAKVNKAGKCIGKKFVSRYYDAAGYGILLYIGTEVAFASCADHTSLLPAPSIDPTSLEVFSGRFGVLKNGEDIYGIDNISKEDLESAICSASKVTSLRIGDYVAVELAPMKALTSRDEVQAQLKAILDDGVLFDIKIQF